MIPRAHALKWTAILIAFALLIALITVVLTLVVIGDPTAAHDLARSSWGLVATALRSTWGWTA